jgi:hypothetical protein
VSACFELPLHSFIRAFIFRSLCSPQLNLSCQIDRDGALRAGGKCSRCWNSLPPLKNRAIPPSRLAARMLTHTRILILSFPAVPWIVATTDTGFTLVGATSVWPMESCLRLNFIDLICFFWRAQCPDTNIEASGVILQPLTCLTNFICYIRTVRPAESVLHVDWISH